MIMFLIDNHSQCGLYLNLKMKEPYYYHANSYSYTRNV